MSGVTEPKKELDEETLTADYVDNAVEFGVGQWDQLLNYFKWTPGDVAAVLSIETAFKALGEYFLETVEDEDAATGIVTLRPKTRVVDAGGSVDPQLVAIAIPLGDKDFRARFKETHGGTLTYIQKPNWIGPA